MAENVTDLTGQKAGKPLGNGFDKDQCTSYIDRVEEVQREIDAIMEKAKAEAAPLRDSIAEIKKEAVDEIGVSRKVLNAKIGERRDIRKALRRREQLDSDHQDELDQLTQALGDFIDTPLGAAAQQEAA